MNTPRIWAHRGAPLGTGTLPPENSLAAFRRALELGADGLEFDLHITADNHLVVYHDLDIPHPTLGKTPIPELSLEQVLEVRLSDGEDRLPTFHQIVESFGSALLVPELKSPQYARKRGLEPVKQLLADIETFGISDRSIVQCFHGGTLDEIRAKQPSQRLLALYRYDQDVNFDSIPGNAEYIGLPMLKVFFSGRELVQIAKKKGVAVVPWREMSVSENPEVFERLQQFEVEAIMVDDAEAALAYYGRCQKVNPCLQAHTDEEPANARRCRKPTSR